MASAQFQSDMYIKQLFFCCMSHATCFTMFCVGLYSLVVLLVKGLACGRGNNVAFNSRIHVLIGTTVLHGFS